MAGIGVDWWDAHNARALPRPGEVLRADDEAVKRLVEENERLKTDKALLNMQNDALRKQIEELSRKPAEFPRIPTESVIVEERKVGGE